MCELTYGAMYFINKNDVGENHSYRVAELLKTENKSFVIFYNYFSLKHIMSNGYIITWILHQIFMYSNKVKLVAD